MNTNLCRICGTSLKDDLFAFVAREPVCAICKVRHLGGRTTDERGIANARARLGLKDGEFVQQDNAAEARRILGRKP